MKKMFSVLMLLFLTVTLSAMSVQPSDSDISIEQTMVKQMADLETISIEPMLVISDVPIVFETSIINDIILPVSIESVTYDVSDSGVPIRYKNYKQYNKQFSIKESLTYDVPDSGIPIC